jgi:multimeric flavodoxin WrbA
MTKVLAINGSAQMEKGNTAMVLTPFIQSMEDEGATVEVVYAKKLKIRPCIGDFQCWFEKVGECIHSDDMQTLFPKMREAEILVLATPVYLPLPGEFQNLLNRLMPICEPILEFRDGRTRAKFHDDVNISKIVLVATGGWWEKGNLDTVLRIAKEIAEDTSVEFAGALLRPHAFLMNEFKEKSAAVDEAIRLAGQQLIRDGMMNSKVLEAISQPLIAEAELRERYNRMYERAKQASG